jgi:hypothetical protein
MNMSGVIAHFAKRLPNLFSRESINALVRNNDVSLEHARESLEAVDMYENAHDKNISTAETIDKMQKLGFYANVKFEAMLEAAKEDERLLYDQFVTIDNARNEAMAKIIDKKEDDVNAVLNSLKTLPKVDPKEIDSLIQIKVRVEDIE